MKTKIERHKNETNINNKKSSVKKEIKVLKEMDNSNKNSSEKKDITKNSTSKIDKIIKKETDESTEISQLGNNIDNNGTKVNDKKNNSNKYKKVKKSKKRTKSHSDDNHRNKKPKTSAEKEKMLSGENYFSYDDVLVMERIQCRKLLKKVNKYGIDNLKKQRKYTKRLFKKRGKKFELIPPFFCDFGYNISVGDRSFFHTNMTILDCTDVTIGHDTLFSPNCSIVAVTSPLTNRKYAEEYTKPVKIGNDCFFGTGSVVCPGVTIGDRVVVAAGSVVSQDVESDTVVGGNPARVIKKLI